MLEDQLFGDMLSVLWCMTLRRAHNREEEPNLQVNFKRENKSGNRTILLALQIFTEQSTGFSC